MKRSHLVILSLSLLAQFAFAAEFTISNGEGKVKRAPEFVKVTLAVQSECYATQEETEAAHKAMVLRVQEALNTQVRQGENFDNLESLPGEVREFERMIGEETFCRGTFQQETLITLTTGDMAGFAERYNNIKRSALLFEGDKNDNSKPRTFVTNRGTRSDICESTRKNLSYEAQGLAIEDAYAKFERYAIKCGIDLEQAKNVSGAETPRYSYARESYGLKSMSEPESFADVNFADIVVSADVSIKFSYPPTDFKCKSF